MVMWAMLLGASAGILGAVWKAAPMLIWAVKQSVCSEEGGSDGEILDGNPTAKVIQSAVDSNFNAAGKMMYKLLSKRSRSRE